MTDQLPNSFSFVDDPRAVRAYVWGLATTYRTGMLDDDVVERVERIARHIETGVWEEADYYEPGNRSTEREEATGEPKRDKQATTPKAARPPRV
jgi:hypothetical protein